MYTRVGNYRRLFFALALITLFMGDTVKAIDPLAATFIGNLIADSVARTRLQGFQNQFQDCVNSYPSESYRRQLEAACTSKPPEIINGTRVRWSISPFAFQEEVNRLRTAFRRERSDFADDISAHLFARGESPVPGRLFHIMMRGRISDEINPLLASFQLLSGDFYDVIATLKWNCLIVKQALEHTTPPPVFSQAPICVGVPEVHTPSWMRLPRTTVSPDFPISFLRSSDEACSHGSLAACQNIMSIRCHCNTRPIERGTAVPASISREEATESQDFCLALPIGGPAEETEDRYWRYALQDLSDRCHTVFRHPRPSGHQTQSLYQPGDWPGTGQELYGTATRLEPGHITAGDCTLQRAVVEPRERSTPLRRGGCSPRARVRLQLNEAGVAHDRTRQGVTRRDSRQH